MNTKEVYQYNQNSAEWPTCACVYKIVNTINGKYYIGGTKNLQSRIRSHRSSSRSTSIKTRSSKLPMYWAIRKYGEESFNIEIIERCSGVEDVFIREQFHLDTITDWSYCYNLNSTAAHVDHSNPEIIKKMKGHGCVKIHQYSLDGVFVREYRSLSEAENDGYHHSKVSQCLGKTRRSAFGYQWVRAEDTPPSPYKKTNTAIRVKGTHKETGEVVIFDSHYLAAKFIFPDLTDDKKISAKSTKICSASKGGRRTAYGYFWKRIDG